VIRVVLALVRRPNLWGPGLRQAKRLAMPGWWRRRPFLPVPSGEYFRFRMLTQYGETERPPNPSDVVNYLEWCREWDRSTHR
jgi:hypothetical protein